MSFIFFISIRAHATLSTRHTTSPPVKKEEEKSGKNVLAEGSKCRRAHDESSHMSHT